MKERDIECVTRLKNALSELVLIVEIHSKATGTNFAWAELPEAKAAIKAANKVT